MYTYCPREVEDKVRWCIDRAEKLAAQGGGGYVEANGVTDSGYSWSVTYRYTPAGVVSAIASSGFRMKPFVPAAPNGCIWIDEGFRYGVLNTWTLVKVAEWEAKQALYKREEEIDRQMGKTPIMSDEWDRLNSEIANVRQMAGEIRVCPQRK